MNSKQFIRSVNRLAAKRGIAVRIDAKRGKGSHAMLFFGGRATVLPRHKDKIPTGTLKSICAKLGITPQDLK